LNSRLPSALALFLARLKRSRIISRMVTIRDPKVIDPRDIVEALRNELKVGCFGIKPASRGPK
jgi:hypothetical protein